VNEIQFLLNLQKTKKSYKWHVQSGHKIRGVARNGRDKGELFDPITAVSRYTRSGTYEVTKRSRQRAGRSLGISSTLTNTIIGATDAKNNRGSEQVLRGRIKEILELK